MALNVTVTANEAFADDATVDRAALRRAAKPTVSITGAVSAAEVGDEAISNAKLEHMAANTVKVRDAGSTGDPSDKAVADTQILIGDGTGFTVAPLSGDVTMANTGAVTIASNSVEGSMLNDNAADEVTIARSGSGGTLSLKADSVGITHLADGTAGTMLSYDATGAVTAVGAGTAGHVLTANASGVPTFQAIPGGPTKLLAYSQSTTAHSPGSGAVTIISMTIPANHGYSHVLIEVDYKGGRDTGEDDAGVLWSLTVGGSEVKTVSAAEFTGTTSLFLVQAAQEKLTWINAGNQTADTAVLFRKTGTSADYDIEAYGYRIWGLTAP